MSSDPKLVAAYLHPGTVSHSFMRSYLAAVYHAQAAGVFAGEVFEQAGTEGVAAGRNNIARRFLSSDADWLVMVDADMGFDHDAFTTLLAVADAEERPIVGGLCFAHLRSDTGDHWSTRASAKPTLYRWHQTDTTCGFEPIWDYPRDCLVEVDGTGAAMLLVHRSVLERIGDEWGDQAPLEWFDRTIIRGIRFSEDLTFCLRARSAGFPIYVHTGVGTSHHKDQYLTESSVDLRAPITVAIPTKNKLGLLRPLVHQLVEQGEADEIIVYDNGSGPEAANWLASRGDLTVVDADGWGIHEMWNDAWDRAAGDGGRANLAILNNDLELGPAFLSSLAAGLRY